MGFIKEVQKLFGEGGRSKPIADDSIPLGEVSKWIVENLGDVEVEDGVRLKEAFTQADIELALDDRGWLVGGKRMAGELDPLSRQVQVNRSRYYWLRDPLVKQAVRLWTDYTLGDTGLKYDCEDEDIKKQLDKFMKNRSNRTVTSHVGQRRLSQRLLVDGELFFGMYSDGVVRLYDCLQITDLITDPDDEDTVWGFKRVMMPRYGGQTPSQYTQKGINKELYYYSWEADGTEPLYDPAKGPTGTSSAVVAEKEVVVYHLPFDNLTQRGNPLISACSDWTREHRRFLTCRVAIMQAISKFAWKSTVKGGQKMINTVRAKLESTFAQTGLSGGTEHQPATAPGGNWLQNEGINVEPMNAKSGAGDARSDGDQLKLMVSAGTGIFLHYFGDPSTGNLATATAMELPMLKMFMSNQVFWRDAWRDLFSIVLEEGPEDEQADITLEYPPMLEDDLQKLGVFFQGVSQEFPEIKVPAVLRTLLNSMNVPNLDEVMDAIQAKRDEIDANVASGKNPDGSAKPVVVPGKPGSPKSGSAAGGSNGLGAGGSSGALESDRLEQLTNALLKLAEAVR